MKLFEMAGEEPSAMATQPESGDSLRPSGHGMEGAVAVPFTPRQGVAALFADDPLAFLPHGEARLRAWRQAETLYPGQGKEALAMAGYYAGINRTTVGQAFSDLPALLNYWDGGANPKEAYARYRAQLSGKPEERRGLGGALEYGLHGANQLIGNSYLLAGHALVNGLIKLVENDSSGYGQRAPDSLYRLSEKIGEFRDNLNRYHNEEEAEIMGRTVTPGWLTNSDGVGDWLRNAFLTVVAETPRQVVQLMTLATLGPLGGAAWIGAESGYEKYSQLKLEHPELSDDAMTENSVWTGLVNSGTAWMLGDLFFGRDAGSTVFKVGQGALAAGAKRLALSAAYEGGQEYFEQVGENAADIWTGVRGDRSDWTFGDYLRELNQGAPESAFVGFVFGAGTEGATHFGEASSWQKAVNQAALQLGVLRERVFRDAGGVPTRAQAEVISMIDALSDAASPDQQAAAFLAFSAYDRAAEAARSSAARDAELSAPLASPANQEVAAPVPEESGAERRSRLEADADAAEAAHEALRLAQHDPMETAREVNRLAAKVKGVKLRFFIGEGDLPGAARAKLHGMGEEARLPRGLYDGATDTVWVNAALLRPSELPRLVLHEAVAHAGVRKVLGSMYDRVLDAVWKAHSSDPAMLEVVRRYFPDAEYSETATPDGDAVRTPKLTEAQRREAADEFVARYADGRVNSEYRGVEQSWWREFKQRVRMLLARIGWLSDVVMDDREIETLLARAHRRIGSPEWAVRHDSKSGDGVRFDLADLWTGSAADYVKPSLHYVGTGEGSQVFGWGLYSTDNREIAEWYAVNDASRKAPSLLERLRFGGRPFAVAFLEGSKLHTLIKAAVENTRNLDEAVEWLKRRNRANIHVFGADMDGELEARAIEELRSATVEKMTSEGRRHIYRQTWFTNRDNGNEDQWAHLLKWNDEIKDWQKEAILDALAQETDNQAIVEFVNAERRIDAMQDGAEAEDAEYYPSDVLRDYLERYVDLDAATGEYAYKQLADLLGSPKAASEFLRDNCDIDGIVYPANQGDGGDGWNYVSFRDDNMRVDEHIRFDLTDPASYQHDGEERAAAAVRIVELVGNPELLRNYRGASIDMGRVSPSVLETARVRLGVNILDEQTRMVLAPNELRHIFNEHGKGLSPEEMADFLHVVDAPSHLAYTEGRRHGQRFRFLLLNENGDKIAAAFYNQKKNTLNIKTAFQAGEGENTLQKWKERGIRLGEVANSSNRPDSSGRPVAKPALIGPAEPRSSDINVTPNSNTASDLDDKGQNKSNSDVRLSLESYSATEGAQAVAVLRPLLLEWETATPEACLEYLKEHGFRNFDLEDAEELMREADRQNLYGDAEAARESLERSQVENADPLSDGGKRVAELVRGMVKARKSDDDIRIELARLGVSLPQERLESLLLSARNGLRPDARRAFRERRDQWLAETDPLFQAMQDHGYNPSRIYIRPGQRFLGEEFRGGFIDPAWRRVSKAGQKLDERTRERLLASQGDRYRMSVPLDVLAHNLLSDHPGLASDEAALEERILARFNGLTEAALDEEFRDARRREAAEERLYAEDAEAGWRRDLAERALRRIDAQEPFDAELVREDHELAQEIWTLLTGDRRDVATLSEREIAAADAAIREGIEDAAGFVKGYAEGQRDLPQAVAEARKGDRAKIAERLRKAVERLENQYKEQRARARTEEAELRRRLKEAAEADRVDLESLRIAAQEFARENLPPEVGGEYVGKILALAKYDTKPTRQFPEGRRKAEFRKLMDDMDWAAMEARRARDRKALADLADRYRSRRNWKGVPVSLVPSVQRTVDRIAEVLRMSDAAVDALMAHHVGLAMQLETSEDGRVYDGQRGWSRAELDEDMAILQEYGRLGASPDSKAATALADLRKLAETGKADYAQKIAERTERRKQSAAKLKAELAGTRNVKGRAAEDSDGGRLDWRYQLWTLHTSQLFRRLAGSRMGADYSGTEADRLYRLVEDSSRMQDARNQRSNDRLNDAVRRMTGQDGLWARKEFWKRMETVQEHTGVFVDFYSSEYGSREDGTSFFRQGVRKGQRLAVDVEAARLAVAEFERTGSATVDTEAGVRRLDEMAVGFLKRQLADFDAGLESDVQFSPDEGENEQIKAELAQLRKDGKVQVLLPSKDEVAVRRELALSQGQALQAWLTWRQEDCRAGMRWNGWSDESIRQLEAFLDPQAKALGEWMRAEFRAGRAELDQAAFEKFGAHLPDNEDYFPTRYARNQGAGLAERGGKAATITPGFLASRKFHTLPIDLTQDAFQVFAGAMHDQNHFLAWGRTLDELNGVLGQGDVQEAIRNQYSENFLEELRKRIQGFAHAPETTELQGMFHTLTAIFSANKLGFNPASLMKQALAQVAYAYDVPLTAYGRAMYTAFFNRGDETYQRFLKAAWESDYFRTREGGTMERDMKFLTERLSGHEGGYHPLAEQAVKWQYSTTRLGDSFALLTGGFSVFLHNYESRLAAGMPDAQAFDEGMRAWMRASDETQQSGALKDLSAAQTGWARPLTAFLSIPLEQTSRERTAFAAVWEKGGRNVKGFLDAFRHTEDGRALGRVLLVNHLVVPALMQLVSGAFRYGIHDMWKEQEWSDWVTAMIMGTWDSVVVLGGMAKAGVDWAVRSFMGYDSRPNWKTETVSDIAPQLRDVADQMSRLSADGEALFSGEAGADDMARLIEEALAVGGYALSGTEAGPVLNAGSSVIHQTRRVVKAARDEETLKAEKKGRAKAKARRTHEKNKAKKQEE